MIDGSLGSTSDAGDAETTAAPVFLGNIGDDAIYRVDLASGGLSTIISVIIRDDNIATASSATGATSGFDLDFVKFAYANANSAAEADALAGVPLVNFTSNVTFHAGDMLPVRFGDPPAWNRAYLFGTSPSGRYLPSVATLGTRDGANGVEQGSISLGEDGSIVLTFSRPISTAGLYMYFGDVGNANDGSNVLVSATLPNTPAAIDWSLVASDGFTGEVARTGRVLGTAGEQSIAVLDMPGTIAFDPSFNRGGDVIRLEGDFEDWYVARSGSSAIFFDGDTIITVPVGVGGMDIVFDDAVCRLRIDTAQGAIMLGEQMINALAPITAFASSGAPPAEVGDEDALGRLFVAEGASVVAGGTLDIFGTNGAGEISLTFGKVRLDPSFNRGNQSLALDAPAEDFVATRAGSSVELESPDLEVLIPVGTAGMTINFTDGARTLRYDPALDAILIGEQPITLTPTHLTDFA